MRRQSTVTWKLAPSLTNYSIANITSKYKTTDSIRARILIAPSRKAENIEDFREKTGRFSDCGVPSILKTVPVNREFKLAEFVPQD